MDNKKNVNEDAAITVINSMMDNKKNDNEDAAITVIGNTSTSTDLVNESNLSTSTSTAEILEVPYSIYSMKEKWFIVGVVAVAGLFR
jgi:hypothetical protein